ncbi:MAG: alpha/beta hydrolase [Ruminococcaceae bacterium]|nr:alpha/beta hydrolase [Oscillospiraceae bacterium]
MNINFKGSDISLNVSDTGSGDAVLILHGWGTSMNVYKSIIDYLTPYKRVISYDIPGFGDSSVPSFAFSTDDYADLALAVLGELGINKVSLVGHSHGGRTILNLASRDDTGVEIDKIILIDSAGIVPKKTLMQKLRVKKYKLGKAVLSFAPIKKLFPDAIEKYKSKHGSADYKAVAGTVRDSLVKIVNDDYKNRMANIKCPTLLIWGTKDDATPLSDAEFMEKTIPDAGLVKVEGGSHYSFLDNPGLVKRVIFSFLNIKE